MFTRARWHNAVALWLAIGFVSLILTMWKPALGIVLSLVACASAVSYFVKPNLRPTIERLFMLASESRLRRTTMAIAALAWGVLCIMLSISQIQDRASVHQITKDGTFLAELRKMGFEKVTFSDGFYESWYYDLQPDSESDGGKTVLRGLGLGHPDARARLSHDLLEPRIAPILVTPCSPAPATASSSCSDRSIARRPPDVPRAPSGPATHRYGVPCLRCWADLHQPLRADHHLPVLPQLGVDP